MNVIQITAKLYECRDVAKRFFRENYTDKIAPYKNIIQAVQKKHDIEVLPALLKISESEIYNENGMTQMMFMSAAVELIEPSN